MDIKRNLLIAGLAVVSYLLLLAWNKDYPATVTVPPAATAAIPDTSVPSVNNGADDIPVAPTPQNPAASAATPTTETSGNTVVVQTPSQIVTIDLVGGDIVQLSLPKFPVALDLPDQPFVLLNAQSPMRFTAQTGLVGNNGPDSAASGRPRYQAAQERYSLSEGELNVDLVLPAQNGVSITKRFIFSAEDYLIRVQYLVANEGSSAWSANVFGQIKRSGAPDPSTKSGFGMRTYLGSVMNMPDDPYEKLDFGDIDKGGNSYTGIGGWIGFSQHYFLSSWIPAADAMNNFSTRKNAAGDYLMGYVGPETVVAPGQSAVLESALWAGPKDQYRLEEIAPDLGLAIDYGKFWFVAYPVFWLLYKINGLVGNFGFSIVLLTLVIRLLFYPLSVKQFRSQANMKRLQPKIAQLKEKHGDDKQKFMQAQMELWKKENVNPFSGCLPPLLQMPVFLGIYWVLNESVELRHAGFMLWYHDLSAMDPYFVLPLLLGAAYYLQQHMTPMMISDPTQAKVMKFMPVMFTVFFLWFPAGLVLYYLANAVIGILQQWYFTRKNEKQYAAAAKG